MNDNAIIDAVTCKPNNDKSSKEEDNVSFHFNYYLKNVHTLLCENIA